LFASESLDWSAEDYEEVVTDWGVPDELFQLHISAELIFY